MANNFTIKFDMGQLAAFDELAKDIAEAARPAAQAGAQVIYDEVKRNVAKLKRHTGNLDRSIYQAYSEDKSHGNYHEYHVSWNGRKAPHGHLVEYGHLMRYKVTLDKQTGKFVTLRDQPLNPPKLVAARPFLRPAVVAIPRAERAMEQAVIRHLERKGLA